MVTYGVLTVCDRSVMSSNITDLITNCGGTVSLIFENFLWFHDVSGRTGRKSEVKKTFTYLLNGFSVHCLYHSYFCLNGFTFLIIVYSIIVYIIYLF